jgi:dolichol kinase
MLSGEVSWNLLLMLLCYGYVIIILLISNKLPGAMHLSQKTARKFVHAMIGNLPFVIPFFTSNIYPALVAAPFILVTFLASPYSPFKNSKFEGLANITEEGHPLGLVFYAISYTLLALFFASQPYIVAAGILPMAYGDSAGSLVGEKYGKTKYNLRTRKSLEGSLAMFSGSLLSLTIGMAFFSRLYPLQVWKAIAAILTTACVTTLAESISPRGVDNLTVPLLGALTFLLVIGGV